MSISKLIPKCNKSVMAVVAWHTKENLSPNEFGYFQHLDATPRCVSAWAVVSLGFAAS